MAIRLICVLIGYVLGVFQTGYFYGKHKHVDVRTKGSGNTGSTNVLRTLGWQAGLITLLGDCAKAILAAVVVRVIFGGRYPDSIYLLSMYGAAGAVIGHDFPFYMRFKGGKGIATTSGLILSMCIWWMPTSLLIGFILIVALTRYVSLGSLCVVTAFLIEVIVWGQLGRLPMTGTQVYEMYGIAAVLMILAYWKHRKNIVRLLSGKENKISFHSSEA